MHRICSACPYYYLYLRIHFRNPKAFGEMLEQRYREYVGLPVPPHITPGVDARFSRYQSGCVVQSTISKDSNLPHHLLLNLIRSFTTLTQEPGLRKNALLPNVQESAVPSKRWTTPEMIADDAREGKWQMNEEVNELVHDIIKSGALSVQDVLWRWLRSLISKKYSLPSNHGEVPPQIKGERNGSAHRSKQAIVSYSDVSFVIQGLIVELGRKGLVDFVFQVVDWMEGQGWFNLDPPLCASIINNLGKTGSISIAEKVFSHLDNMNVCKDSVTYNAMLNIYNKEGQTEATLKLFNNMKHRFKPDVVTFNTVMDACVKGGMDLGKVVSVFKEMCLLGIDPDMISYNVAIAACSSGKHAKEAEMFFQNAKKKGLKPTIISYTSLMSVYANAGDCAAVLRVFREMIANDLHPNEVAFSCLINAFGIEGQVEEAETVFEAMSDYGVAPNVVVCNSMINMYNKNGLPNHAQQMFHRMVDAGMEPTSSSFMSLMSSFKALEGYNEVVDIYEHVRGNDSLCNVYTYTEALDSCLKWGNWKKVASVLADMQSVGCVPNFVTCSILLSALGSRCRSSEDADMIMDFLRSFESKLLSNVCQMLEGIFQTDIEVKQLAEGIFLQIDEHDTKTCSVFTSSLVDALWTFGWCRRAALVTGWALEKMDNVDFIAVTSNEWKLDVRRFSSGGALVMFYQWLAVLFRLATKLSSSKPKEISQDAEATEDGQSYDEVSQIPSEMLYHSKAISKNVVSEKSSTFSFPQILRKPEVLVPFLYITPTVWSAIPESSAGSPSNVPRFLTVVTGWGKFSIHEGKSMVKDSIQREILKLGAPFRPSADFGRWIADGNVLVHWLLKSEVAEHLRLYDEAAKCRE